MIATTAGRRGVAATVTVRATELADLRDELVAHQAESQAFGERIRVGVDRIIAAASAGSRMAVVNEAGKLGHAADRFLRQRGQA